MGDEIKSLKTPILVMGVVLILLALAWLPGYDTPIQQRPYVDLHLQYDAGNSRLEQLATDVRYRMGTHHEYRILSEQTLLHDDFTVHRVRIDLSEESGVIYMRALVDEQALEVNGPRQAASSLSAKMFSLINDTITQP